MFKVTSFSFVIKRPSITVSKYTLLRFIFFQKDVFYIYKPFNIVTITPLQPSHYTEHNSINSFKQKWNCPFFISKAIHIESLVHMNKVMKLLKYFVQFVEVY